MPGPPVVAKSLGIDGQSVASGGRSIASSGIGARGRRTSLIDMRGATGTGLGRSQSPAVGSRASPAFLRKKRSMRSNASFRSNSSKGSSSQVAEAMAALKKGKSGKNLLRKRMSHTNAQMNQLLAKRSFRFKKSHVAQKEEQRKQMMALDAFGSPNESRHGKAPPSLTGSPPDQKRRLRGPSPSASDGHKSVKDGRGSRQGAMDTEGSIQPFDMEGFVSRPVVVRADSGLKPQMLVSSGTGASTE